MPGPGLPENDVRVRACRTVDADEDLLTTLELDRIDVVLVVPEVERRVDPVRPAPERRSVVGGGAILCPGVEVGEEAFVGAGAVVTKDVPPRTLVVGNPARVLRNVPEDELLENQ